MFGKLCLRRATLLLFGAIALAAFVAANDDSESSDTTTLHQTDTELPESFSYGEQNGGSHVDAPDFDSVAEANRAFKQAINILNTIAQDRTQLIFDPSSAFETHGSRSILSALVPNPESHGIMASALRLLTRLRQNPLLLEIFATISNPTGSTRQRRKERDIRGKTVKVLDLLQWSSELGHHEALYVLAQISLFPPNDFFPSDPTLAYRSLVSHARTTGNATSQALLAFFHSTGYHHVVPVNQALAQLYYTFAANGGHKGAQMALGYRYLMGIGTLDSCEDALRWYELAADQTMDQFYAGPPGGRTLPHTATRLSDLVGGAYGYGSSVASTGPNAHRPAVKAGLARAAGETWEEVMEYYMFNADRGETDFAYRLGKIFYMGSIYASPGGISSGAEGVGAVPQSFTKAMHYFLMIARKMWPKDPSDPSRDNPEDTKEDLHGADRYAVFCAGYIGRMFLRGEGVKQNMALARMWFNRGAVFGDRESQNGLGIMWRDGLIPGEVASWKEAKKYFSQAAKEHSPEAQVNLGKHHYERGDLAGAVSMFDSAMRSGSPLETWYYLGAIQSANVAAASSGAGGVSVSGSCGMAVSFYKQVVERGTWEEDFVKEAEAAWMSGTQLGKEVAILKWWIAAERGQEIAQTNLAFVLDQDRSILRLTRFSPFMPSNETALLALTQWTRAASQRNIDALVKVGDYYYHGLGVPQEAEAERFEKAAKYYQSAADTHLSSLAMWNLGWMYENGIGVPRDFHLAKRNYDLALEYNPDSYIPVLLSLLKLYAKSIWYTLQGGEDGLNIWDLGQLEDAGSTGVDEIDPASPEPDDSSFLEDKDDEVWYIGKARDELRRRTRAQQPDNENDPVQWARDRRQGDDDLGPEDYFDAALRGGNREQDLEDEFTDVMVIMLLCLLISILIYVRTRLLEDRQQRPAEDNQRNGNPPPGPLL